MNKKSESVWKDLLKGEKIISDEEAKSLAEELRKIRKEKGWRN